jgi:tetratricopeptide (TPR) repeat protein
MERSRVFISYSHKDIDFLTRLNVHLKHLERKGLVDVWSDLKIKTGDDWRKEIENALVSASVAILLVSADFLASDFIANDELPKLLDAAQTRGTRIIPVILKTCAYLRTPELAKFQSINNPAKPVINMSHGKREELWDKVAQAVTEDISQATEDEKKQSVPNGFPTNIHLQYRSGQHIRHKKFGDGIVLESQLTQGNEEVRIRFENKQHGTKRLAIKFSDLEIIRNEPKSLDEAMTLIEEARQALKLNDLDLALSLAENVAYVWPDNLMANYVIANTAFRLNKFEKALEHGLRILDYEDNITGYSIVASSLMELGRWDDAVPYLQKEYNLTMPDKKFEVWVKLGSAYDHIGNLDQAIDCYRAAGNLAENMSDRELMRNKITYLRTLQGKKGKRG